MIYRQKSMLFQTINNSELFGSTLMLLDNPFFVTLNNIGLLTIIDENGDKLIVLDPNLDQEKQNQQIIDLINQNVDIIFLAPVDWKGVKQALEAANEAGIPVFNVDAPVYNEELVTTIIASDNYKVGVLIAQDMMQRLDEAKIVIIDYPPAKSTIDRIQGFKDTILNKPQYEIVVQKTGEGPDLTAKNLMKEVIDDNIDFNVVFGINDVTAKGIVEALQEANKIQDTLVYGVDGSPEGKQMVKEGLLTATVAQSPIEIGMTAAELGYVYLQGDHVPKYVTIPVYIINKENINDYDLLSWQ
ncbi:sugar ABC transporter substrate-binding protein [Anaerosacchariphilus polymeriproducens]|uniref:Sugar ABC transporter substrate-binding protein n=1 Tax=Anaerosacchariphilus polymeriproducens TaxID=1812858 RepID=A0A371AXR8_9FIRM|nr:sugar ABC transporter substrate-binding protein [Anaerosacchariphilus polymeriproducens]RDU24364.1 sugar ABC transporter substrate-binding protein [Anaerosacchariphilus polymeriproducens]